MEDATLSLTPMLNMLVIILYMDAKREEAGSDEGRDYAGDELFYGENWRSNCRSFSIIFSRTQSSLTTSTSFPSQRIPRTDRSPGLWSPSGVTILLNVGKILQVSGAFFPVSESA